MPAPVADLDLTLAALADPGRRAIIELLQERPQRPSDVAEALEMTRPAMSRHLRILRTAGLVEQETPEEDARARTISLCRAPFSQLREWVEEVEAFWTEELAAFKSYAEQKHAEHKAAAKAEAKHEARAEARAEAKGEARHEAKGEPRPDKRGKKR